MSDVIVGQNGFSTGFDLGYRSPLDTIIISAYIPNITINISDVNVDISSTTVSTTFLIPDHTVIISLPDWDECTELPTSYWDKENECHSRDKELYSTLQTNAWNNLGVPVIYYVTDYNTSHDVIFGEDNDRYVIRSFDLMSYYELPRENELWTRFGIEGIDNFHMYVSKEHMAFASTYSGSTSSVFDSHTPHVGDIIKAKYNDYYYEVVSVKQYDNQFLQTQHSWDFTVRPFRDFHLTLSASVSSDSISSEIDKSDILTITSSVDNEKTNILYTSSSSETPPDDPFAGW